MEWPIKFIRYKPLERDDLPVEWLQHNPDNVTHYAIVRAAGFEPEDPTVNLGVLRSRWGDRETGCLVVCYGAPTVGQRFMVSEEPITLDAG